MQTITAYRFNDFYFFRAPVTGAEEVTLQLADGVEVIEDELGVKRVYTDLAKQGVGLTTAVAQGWCHPVCRRGAAARPGGSGCAGPRSPG